MSIKRIDTAKIKSAVKRLSAVLLVLALSLLVCSCSGGQKSSAESGGAEAPKGNTASQSLPTVLDTTEYLLYQNIFFNGAGADYNGTRVTKKGTFATIYDAYSKTNRYFVWGY